MRNSISCLSSLKVVYLLRWNVFRHRFGYRHRTTQLKILCTTAFTSRRIRRSFLTVTKFITTRRGIRIRTHQLISVGSHANKWNPYDRLSFKPERFLGDTTTCAESCNLPDAMDRDHWAFGAGYVHILQKSFLLCRQPSPVSSLTFTSNSSQPSHLSGHPSRRTAAVACDLTVALGF